MINRINILFIYLLLTLFLFENSYTQSFQTENDFLSQNLILSLGGGISYGFTDYKNSKIGPIVKGSLEYYPIVIQNARLGIKAFAGGLTLNFEDSRNLISSNDGFREIPAKIETDAIQLGTGITLGYAFSNYVIPSITVGGSFLRFSPKDSDGKVRPFNKANVYKKDIFSFYLDGELKIKISDHFSIHTQLSYHPLSTDYLEDVSTSANNDSYLTGIVGISFAFTGNLDSDGDGVNDKNDQCPNTPLRVTVDEFGCPIDSDNDGVADYMDKSPNTPIGVKVDLNGIPLDSDSDGIPDYLDKCPETPLNVETDSIGCAIDSDVDGVPDYMDKCNNTPIGIEVDEFGCAIDTDKDGVPDYLDKCPNTIANTNVDSTGCPDNQNVNAVETFYQFILRGDDTFKTNSDSLIGLAKILLDEIAAYIKNQPGSKWRIEGYMDNQGSISYLKKLSYNRAKTTLNYLISKGLSESQFTIFGLGDSFPIANNNTPEGRSTNRRILIIREN